MDGEDQPATSQIFHNEHPDGPCPGRGDTSGVLGSDSNGALQPKEEYARVIASTNYLEIPGFVTGPTLARLPKPTKSCSDFRGRTLNVYTQGPDEAEQGQFLATR